MVGYVVIAALVALVGCAPKPILMNQQAKESLSAIQELKVLYYEAPEFLIPPTTGPMSFGAVGGSVGGVAGTVAGAVAGGAGGGIAASADQFWRVQLKTLGVNDPILQVKNGFLPSMQTSLPKATLSEVPHSLRDDDLEKLKKELGQGYLIDFKTIKWGVINTRLHAYSYVLYRSRARLVNISEEKIIWQGVCDLEENDSTTRPSIHDFMADEGTLLKDYLTRLTTSCVAELNRQLTGTSPHK